jgi:hypothetical protein
MGGNSSLWGILLWAEVLICAVFSVLLIQTIRRYDIKKKQFKDDLKAVKEARLLLDRMDGNGQTNSSY